MTAWLPQDKCVNFTCPFLAAGFLSFKHGIRAFGANKKVCSYQMSGKSTDNHRDVNSNEARGKMPIMHTKLQVSIMFSFLSK